MQLQGNLSKSKLDRITEPGRYSDGPGRFGLSVLVKVRKDGKVGKYFTQRLRINGKWAYIGLGSYPRVALSKARAAALANVQKVDDGIDPRPDKGGSPGPATPTFKDAVIKAHAGIVSEYKDGKEGKNARQWIGMMRLHVLPTIGNLPIDTVGIADVKAVIQPLWADKRTTAMKVHNRIAQVMDWAISEGLRSENPCGSALLSGLPRNGGNGGNFAAMHHADVEEVLRELRELGIDERKRPAIDAFEWLTLTATRSNETRGARWSEIELCGPEGMVWTIPAERMKGGISHRVPVTAEMVDVLARAQTYDKAKQDGFIFPNQRGGMMDDTRLSRLLQGMDATVHGMRSSFRDWAAENAVERELAEASLAHKVAGVEGRYFRSDLLARRREVMEAWSEYVTGREPAMEAPVPLRFVA